jgi:hypothetical protein
MCRHITYDEKQALPFSRDALASSGGKTDKAHHFSVAGFGDDDHICF